MEEIKITKSKEKDTFNLEVGNGLAEDLNYDEMLGLVSSLTMQSLGTCKPCMGYLHKKEEHYEPKDGDFVISEVVSTDGYLSKWYIIYKESKNLKNPKYYACYAKDSELGITFDLSLGYVRGDQIRPATDSEKQHLLDALHKEGKDWDESKKEIVEYRWKPKRGESFWFIDEGFGIVFIDSYVPALFNLAHLIAVDNCFRTREEAQAMADKFKELLKGE